MGGERASTTRMRESGRICCNCHVPLPRPRPEERYCAKCEPRRRVYMHYMPAAKAWSIQFLEEDLKTSLRRKFTFKDEQKVRGLVERGSTERTVADHQALEHGISMGRGGVWLQLTTEQYARLE